MTPGQPVLVTILWRQEPGRVATGVPIFKPLVWFDAGKSRRKRESNPGTGALEADALTSRPEGRTGRGRGVDRISKESDGKGGRQEKPYMCTV